jgi:glutamate racemase
MPLTKTLRQSLIAETTPYVVERTTALNPSLVSVGCSGLVELIEEGRTDEASVHAYLEKRLEHLTGQQIDAVVLGCTHYSFAEASIKSYIDRAFHTDCPVFDGRHGTARQLQRVLDEQGIRRNAGTPGSVHFFCSAADYPPERFKGIFLSFNS